MQSGSYYDRESAQHIDGSLIFKTREDRESEAFVAREISEAWKCELLSFGDLCPIDWYAVRDGRFVGVIELKTRSHARNRYPTTFLNMRKWLALTMAEQWTGAPAILAVRFTDGVYWAPISRLKAPLTVRVGGCTHIVKSRSDVEPQVEVPIEALRPLRKETDAEISRRQAEEGIPEQPLGGVRNDEQARLYEGQPGDGGGARGGSEA
jgi:hypothetical protein